MEKKIVILENDWTDYEKFRSYFPGYNYYPDVQNLKDLLEFLQDIKDALNDLLPEQERKTNKDKIISLFQEHCKDVFAYIIDYQLKSEDKFLTGIAFHRLFIRGEYKKIYTDKDMPCIMPTKMTGNTVHSIRTYTESINDPSLFSFINKPNAGEDDSEYKRILQDFVKNANPRVMLAKENYKISFNHFDEEIYTILIDIIDNPDSYNDDIDGILSGCLEHKSGYDKKYLRPFIDNLKRYKK